MTPHVSAVCREASLQCIDFNTHHICPKVNAEYSDGPEGKGNASKDKHYEWSQFRDVGGQCVGNRLLQVVKDQTS